VEIMQARLAIYSSPPNKSPQAMPEERHDCIRTSSARHACAYRSAGLRIVSMRLMTLVFLLIAMRADAQVYAIGVGSRVGGYEMTTLRIYEHRWLAGSVGLV
jgi:hypothetical protein